MNLSDFIGGGGDPLYTFGDGSDGNVTISGPVTLTRDMYYKNLTLSGAAALNTAGFRVFVSGTLDLSAAPAGAIVVNGTAGADAAGINGGANGTSPATSATVYSMTVPIGYTNVATAPTGGATVGTAATSAGFLPVAGFMGGGGGQGGAGGAGSGGAGGAVSNDQSNNSTYYPPLWTASEFAFAAVLINADSNQVSGAYVLTKQPIRIGVAGNSSNGVGAGYGGCGASGAGGGANGGGGGGRGGAPHCVAIAARTIARGTNATAGIIQAKGGKGGKGGTPASGNGGGGGGGGGAGGGWVAILCQFLTGSQIANAIDVSGGDGGNGGNGIGTGKGGQGGTSGQTGRVTFAQYTQGQGLSITVTAPVNGSTPAVPATIAGSAGPTNTLQVAL